MLEWPNCDDQAARSEFAFVPSRIEIRMGLAENDLKPSGLSKLTVGRVS